MSSDAERDYLNEKFSGLEKLVTAKHENLKEYIQAVSAKTEAIRKEAKDDLEKTSNALVEHEKDTEAHGLGAANKKDGSFVQWGVLIVSILALFFSLVKK